MIMNDENDDDDDDDDDYCDAIWAKKNFVSADLRCIKWKGNWCDVISSETIKIWRLISMDTSTYLRTERHELNYAVSWLLTWRTALWGYTCKADRHKRSGVPNHTLMCYTKNAIDIQIYMVCTSLDQVMSGRVILYMILMINGGNEQHTYWYDIVY